MNRPELLFSQRLSTSNHENTGFALNCRDIRGAVNNVESRAAAPHNSGETCFLNSGESLNSSLESLSKIRGKLAVEIVGETIRE